MKFFKKVLKNKLFYLFIVLGVFVIPILKFNLQAQEEPLLVYSDNNLAMPDLEGKEYLGDGVYRLYDDRGITLDYNVYRGEYIVNGTTTSEIYYVIMTYTNDEPLYASAYYISGEFTGADDIFIHTNPYHVNNSISFRYTNKSTPFIVPMSDFRVLFRENTVFDNYKFKLQLEKDDTATPYTVPGQIPQYKIVGEE